MQSDERLSKLFTRGVDPAFDELVRRYRGPLTVFAGGIVGRDRAEDVVQESLVKAHRSMAAEEVAEPKAWLYKVVRNTALNEIRDGSKHDHAELTDREPGRTGDQASEEAERREELAMLISALAELPESQRTALVGRELGGYSHDELAAKLGVSRGATKQLIFRARTGLRNALGALFPMPLIVWLASDATGTFLASGAGSAAAAGVAGVTGGAGGAAGGAAAGATGAAAGGGLFAGLAGGGAAKVAVVAAVAGGTVAAGVAVENERASQSDTRPAVVRPLESSDAVSVAGGTSAGTGVGAGGSSGQGRPGGDASRPGDRPAATGTSGEQGRKDAADLDAAPGGEETSTANPVVGTGRGPGKGLGERPWKDSGFERPWKGSGSGKGLGGRPWKDTVSGVGTRPDRPWKDTVSGVGTRPDRPWKGSGSGGGSGLGRPWKGSGSGGGGAAQGKPTFRPPATGSGGGSGGSGSSGRPFGGSGSSSGSGVGGGSGGRPFGGSGGRGQSSSPVTEAPAARPGGGRLGGGIRGSRD